MGSSHALTTCTDLYFRPKLFIISDFIVVIIPMLCEQLPASYGLRSGSFSLTTRSAAEPLGLARLLMCTSTTQADLSTYHSGWVKTTLLHLGWIFSHETVVTKSDVLNWLTLFPTGGQRHQAPWCLDAFPIALSWRPPIPAVAPPSMPASTSRTFQPSMPAMSWSSRIPPSAELATADAVVKHGSPTQRCRTALKFSEAWQLLAALRSWPWSLGLAVASNIENKPTSVKKTSLHYDFSVLGSDFSWRL